MSARIADLAGDARDLLDDVMRGTSDWKDLMRLISSGFAGSFAALVSQDAEKRDLNFFAVHNLDQSCVETYVEQYAQINPWNHFWQEMRPGDMLISEEQAPARLYRDTEFYRDWLGPLKEFDAGAGLQVALGEGHVVYLPIHYNPEHHAQYAPQITEFFRGFGQHLRHSLEILRHFDEAQTVALAQGAVAAHFHNPAFVLSAKMGVTSVNKAAEELFGKDGFFRVRGGQLSLSGPADHAALADAVRRLATGLPAARDRFLFRWHADMWLIRLVSIRARPGIAAGLTPVTTQVLIVATNLRQSVPRASLLHFAQEYRLTPAELRMCAVLARGASVTAAAEELEISANTARQRLKVIFEKTGCHRQSELVGLILRFA